VRIKIEMSYNQHTAAYGSQPRDKVNNVSKTNVCSSGAFIKIVADDD